MDLQTFEATLFAMRKYIEIYKRIQESTLSSISQTCVASTRARPDPSKDLVKSRFFKNRELY